MGTCTRKPSFRGAVGAACGAALLLAVGACGSDAAGGASSAAGTLASSSSGTKASTAREASTAPATSAANLVRRINAAARAKRTVRMTLSTQSKGQSSTVQATGALRLGSGGSDLAMDMTTAGHKLSMVFVHGVFYLDIGQPVAGKTWLKISPTGKDPVSKAFGPMLQSLGSDSSLQGRLAGLEGARITSAAPTTIDAAPVTTYTIALTERNLVASVDALGYPAQVKKSVAALFKGATGRTVLTVDSDNLVRKITSSVTSPTQNATTTITYRGWGEPVAIKVPAASDVADPSALVP